MGQILGLRISHYPELSMLGNVTRRIKTCLAGAMADLKRNPDEAVFPES